MPFRRRAYIASGQQESYVPTMLEDIRLVNDRRVISCKNIININGKSYTEHKVLIITYTEHKVPIVFS